MPRNCLPLDSTDEYRTHLDPRPVAVEKVQIYREDCEQTQGEALVEYSVENSNADQSRIWILHRLYFAVWNL